MTNLGYSETIEEMKYKKLPSLAVNIANSKKEPWMGVFDIGGGLYWYVAVRDNQAILPDGDIVGTKAEIDKIFNETISLDKWDTIIENGNIEDIANLITDSNIYVLKYQNTVYTAIIIVLGIIIALGGIYYYRSHFIKKPKIFIPKIFKQITPIKIPGFKIIPKPYLIFNSCKKTLSGIQTDYSGWRLTTLSCADNSIVSIYDKQSFGTAILAPKGILSQNGMQITQTKVLNFSRPSDFRKLLQEQKVVSLIYGYKQELNLTGSIQNTGRKLNITLNLNNIDILPIFFTIPSFRVKSIKFSFVSAGVQTNIIAEVWYE